MRTETVSFPGPDRRTVNCLVYRPDAAARATVFLVPARPLFPTDYEWLVRPLVDAGLTVVGVYQRGFGSEGADDRSGPKAVGTIRKAVGTLLDKGVVTDPVAIVGHASGAQTALLTAAADERFKAVVALAPLADLAAHVKAARGYLPNIDDEHRQLFGEVFEDADEAYRTRSPIHVADQIKSPVLLLSGEMDHVVPPYHARALHQALEASGTAARCLVLPWLGHFFEAFGFHGHQFERILDETLSWLSTHVAVLAPAENGGNADSRGPSTKRGPGTAVADTQLGEGRAPVSSNGSPATDTTPTPAPAPEPRAKSV